MTFPVQPPLQPVKVDPPVAVGVKSTCVPAANAAVHVVAQLLIPAGALLTLPVPAPALVTVNESVGAGPKVAVTDVAALIVTVQSPGPLHAPPQVTNADPALGIAASVTWVPAPKLAEHVAALQLIPAGVLVTVPLPVEVTWRA